MGSLTAHGYIAIVEIVIYVITLTYSITNCLRYGFKRQAGWVYLSFFCVLRLCASVLVIIVEKSSHPSSAMIAAEVTVSSIALTPLHLALLGFLTTSAQLALGEIPENFTKLFRLCRVVLLVAIILGIVGGNKLADDSVSQTGHTMSRVSISLIVGVFVVLTLVTLYFLIFAQLDSQSRALTIGIAVALPFLLVRIIYALVNAFSSSTANKFNDLTGDWVIYLVMGVIMEFIVVAVLTATGFKLQKYSGKEKMVDRRSALEYELRQAGYGVHGRALRNAETIE
ncbi:hypothetical protein V1520DRAFT_348396 [Lipomyces starkeyi]|uniref:DUF7702 domain-containing protein n=1 Tax=Lipomyces starkeyi NRRL Y-11557 TaxID=675824 RepID=A0A1E3QG58_LIPST|nr:hypothetical protein LIPSTDRAFT_66898 [Lipomyces starkeyi NRRL Y-11557]